MRIGIMLRNVGERGGIWVYTSNLLRALFDLDRQNHYLLIYRQEDQKGHFGAAPNIEEVVAPAPNKLWWDQISVPQVARKARLDVIFHPKLTVPLFTRSKTVLVMHGAEQFAVPEVFPFHDRVYFTVANRLYCKMASAVISMTHLGGQDIVKYMGAPPENIHVIPESYNEACGLIDEAARRAVKEKYSLPDRYILFVGGISPLKNFGNLLRAYKLLSDSSYPHKLVVVGFKRWKFSKDIALVDELGLTDRVVFTDFIADEDIPGMYNLAEVFAFPSLYEGFGMPVLEAMACGCPVVTTKTGCSPEVAGGAALLVDPYDPVEISQGIRRVLDDARLRESLAAKGLARSREFSWNKCARQTLSLFKSLARGSA